MTVDSKLHNKPMLVHCSDGGECLHSTVKIAEVVMNIFSRRLTHFQAVAVAFSSPSTQILSSRRSKT